MDSHARLYISFWLYRSDGWGAVVLTSMFLSMYFFTGFDHCVVRVADSNQTFPSNICGPHGACVSRSTGFQCLCDAGYSGLLCQYGKLVYIQSFTLVTLEEVFEGAQSRLQDYFTDFLKFKNITKKENEIAKLDSCTCRPFSRSRV